MTIPVLPPLTWKESPNTYANRTLEANLIVLHDCQGGFEGSINTFLDGNSANPVSAHFVLKEDGSQCVQMVALSDVAWHVRTFNSRAVGVEMAGSESAGYGEAEWQAAANMLAWLLDYHDLPVRWAQGGGGPGFCRHYDLGKAGGSHTDPTTDPVVWEAFIKRLEATSALGFQPKWEGLHE